MDPAQVEHAQRVARQLVSLGYTDKNTARTHFRDYLLYLNLGFSGDFAQILHARKVIDDRGLSLIQQAVPSPTAPQQTVSSTQAKAGDEVGMSSMVIRLPQSWPQQAQAMMQSGVAPARPPSGGYPVVPPPAQPQPRVQLPPSGYGQPVPQVPTAPTASPSGRHTWQPPAPAPPPHAPRAPSSQAMDFLKQAQDALKKRDDEAAPPPATPQATPEGTLPMEDGFDEEAAGRSVEDLLAVDLPDQRQSGAHRLPKPDPVEPVKSPTATGGFDPMGEGWASNSTPSVDSDTQAPEDTGEIFWKSESGDQDDSPFLEPKVGGFMGEFELLEVLGQGGMGVVFRVRHQGSNGIYALKVLRVRKGAKTETRRKRFRTEVQAMQRLEHGGIVAVHGYGRDGPFDWYVMDYVEGKDLAGLLKAQALNLEQKLQVFKQICESLVHAHGRGVIHRDLKPQNILVDPDLKASILDFGLAKLLDDEDGMTHTGSALGTPFYMSPEQIATPRGVGPRADVFAMGVVLYEMITGRRPFTGHSAGEVGNKILTVDPPKPSRINPALHNNLDVICMRALEKSPDRRYQSIEGMLGELDAHLSGKGLRTESQFAGIRRWVERNKSGFLGGVIVAMLVVGLLGALALLIWAVFSD
jgi:tRNA A-37 threonylcarbamoyl transferase component Bud32